MCIKKKEYWKNERVYSWTGPIEDIIALDIGYDLVFDKNSHFVLEYSHFNKDPRVGDILTIYTVNLTKVVGASINGELLFFLPEN